MERHKLGQSDLELTEVGLGCWIMGRAGWTDVHDDESIAAIHTALELWASTSWL